MTGDASANERCGVDLPFAGQPVRQLLPGAAVCLLALWLLRASARVLGRRAARARQRTALRAERDAEGLLRALGYRILGRQVQRTLTLDVDGDPHPVQLRADYLVSRNGQRLVAEVKSGSEAPRLSLASTRRQLLEYGMAFDADGTLLVDMAQGRVRRVRFPAPQAGARSRWLALLWFACGLIAGRFL